MRTSLWFLALASTACRDQSAPPTPSSTRASTSAMTSSTTRSSAAPSASASASAPTGNLAAPCTQPRAAEKGKRSCMTTVPLAVADNGVDGTFELWRDSELTDAFVKSHWPLCAHESDADASKEYLRSQLILRDSTGKILQSRDMEFPQATLETTPLGDPPTQTIMVSLDTDGCGSARWSGSTHLFGRVERGKTIWFDCAKLYRFPLSANFHAERREGSDVRDLLAWHQVMGEDATDFFRITLTSGGECIVKTRKAPGWPDTIRPTDYPPP